MSEVESLKNIIVDIIEDCKPEDISETTNFVEDLGADSLDLFQIITRIEDEYGIEFDLEKAENVKTVGDAVAEIRAQVKQ
ncbi:MAG: acyl carrier protein [Eubacteriales bacterium]|nr:acyl carrier protein [Eubacteriales bacterium]